MKPEIDKLLWSFIEKYVYIGDDLRGGVPCIIGTRIPVSQLLVDLAEPGTTIEEFANDYDIDLATCKNIVEGLSFYLFNKFAQPKSKES